MDNRREILHDVCPVDSETVGILGGRYTVAIYCFSKHTQCAECVKTPHGTCVRLFLAPCDRRVPVA